MTNHAPGAQLLLEPRTCTDRAPQMGPDLDAMFEALFDALAASSDPAERAAAVSQRTVRTLRAGRPASDVAAWLLATANETSRNPANAAKCTRTALEAATKAAGSGSIEALTLEQLLTAVTTTADMALLAAMVCSNRTTVATAAILELDARVTGDPQLLRDAAAVADSLRVMPERLDQVRSIEILASALASPSLPSRPAITLPLVIERIIPALAAGELGDLGLCNLHVGHAVAAIERVGRSVSREGARVVLEALEAHQVPQVSPALVFARGRLARKAR